MKKDKLLLAAVAGISLGVSTAPAAIAEEAATVKCYGVNSCGHHASCAVTGKDVDAVKGLLGDAEYQKQFGKTQTHSCGHSAKCGASANILNWTRTTGDECHAKGGILIETSEGKR